jgi:hypothetical protein
VLVDVGSWIKEGKAILKVYRKIRKEKRES